MSIEAMKLALEALETAESFDIDADDGYYLKAITALRQAIEQASVATNDTSQERVDETAKQQHEPVAWPCVIDTADFEENTVTLKMQTSDYSVGAGLHWLHTSPPQRQPEQEPVVWMYQDKSTHAVKFQKHMSDFVDHSRFYETPLYTTPPQRQPLTDEEIRKAKHHMVEGAYHYSFQQGVRYAEAAHDIKGEA